MSPKIIAIGLVLVGLIGGLVWFLRSPDADPVAEGDKLPRGQVGPAERQDPGRAVSEETPAAPAKGDFSLADKHKSDAPAPGPLFDDWPAPALAIVLSGEMHGYVEPCGCSLNQLGGLSRRADLFRQIRERGWPVTAFDVGGLVSNPTSRQAKIKLREMALAGLKDMAYAGIAFGVEELRLGDDLLTYTGMDKQPFLCCNVLLYDSPDLGVHEPKALVKAGNLTLGVTAVFGEKLKARVLPAGGGEGDVKILDPLPSLTKTVAELEAAKPDLLVLLSHARLDETKEFVEKFPQFDLIVASGGPEDPNPTLLPGSDLAMPRAQFHGKTLVVYPGKKGKSVAVVGYFPKDAEKKLRYEVASLDDKRFKDTPSMIDHMRRYQEALEVQNLVAKEPSISDPRNDQLGADASAPANEFVGAKVCGECHTNAYRIWEKTSHARATQSIQTGRKGQEATYISRIFDPECVACHVTGWDPGRGDPKQYYRYPSGFEGLKESPLLVGQQCENCHGAGSRHTAAERQFKKDGKETDELGKLREFVQVLRSEAAEKLCVKCHDGDNDPHFKTDDAVFDAYWKEIAHPRRD